MQIVPKGAIPFLTFVPPGHYYSPVPNRDDLSLQEERHKRQLTLEGIHSNLDDQMRLVDELVPHLYGNPFLEQSGSGTGRFHFQNGHFEHGDAIILHTLMLHLRPKRIVEVGSGYSSALMLDTDERFLDGTTDLTFIDPFPGRLLSLLRDEDRAHCSILTERVQDVDAAIFRNLDANDILFIDSSHVVRIEGDVNYLLFHVLPLLRQGVYVHFHDIFWPFEYPATWIDEGRAWTEAYALHAFLMYNSAFAVRLFNSQLGQLREEQLRERLPTFMTNPGGSIWLERL